MQKSKCKTGKRFPSFDFCILHFDLFAVGPNPPQPHTAAEVNRARFWLRPKAALGDRFIPDHSSLVPAATKLDIHKHIAYK
ncbi:MAG TPA: hypothetical protein VG125_24910 [Pirellulales bacterium]|jgi:hypothetical protein|nr:hypothetical protein [Pirellulales bacterium]